jgi:hypothetical protein
MTPLYQNAKGQIEALSDKGNVFLSSVEKVPYRPVLGMREQNFAQMG